MPRKKGRKVAKKNISRRYSVEERAQMVGQKKLGTTTSELMRLWGAGDSTVKNLWKKYNKTGSIKDLPRSGRARETEKEDRHIAITVARNPHVTAKFMAKRLVPGFCKKPVSRWTVARVAR